MSIKCLNHQTFAGVEAGKYAGRAPLPLPERDVCIIGRFPSSRALELARDLSTVSEDSILGLDLPEIFDTCSNTENPKTLVFQTGVMRITYGSCTFLEFCIGLPVCPPREIRVCWGHDQDQQDHFTHGNDSGDIQGES